MKPQDYCKNLVTPVGSDLRYCLRGLDQQKQAVITTIHAFFNTITDILITVTDDQVAQQKLLWWQDEIKKTLSGEAKHPISQALLQHKNYLSILQLSDLINSTQQLLKYCHFDTFEELSIHIIKTYGMRDLMVAKLFDVKADGHKDLIYQCAMILALTHYIRELRPYITRGFFMLPKNDMEQCCVDRQSLTNFKMHDKITSLIAMQHDKINNAFKNIHQGKQHISSVLYKQCKLAHKWWELVKTERYDVLSQRVEVPMLRKVLSVILR